MKKLRIVLFNIAVMFPLSLSAEVISEQAVGDILPFAPAGSEWHYTCTSLCCPENHFNHIISEKDTTVEGNSCRILRQYYNNSSIASEKYIIKQEQGKVYYYYRNQFNLLFDFDAEVNDTVEIKFVYKEYYIDNNSFENIKDSVLSVRYLVEDITTNAQNLKTFTTKGIDEFYYGDGIHRPPYRYIYTERIGLHSEFMPMYDNKGYPDVIFFRWLRCYSDAGFSFVSDQWATKSLPCNYSIATGTNTPKDENSIIYPNPFSDNVFVFSHNGGKIEIIDISGKVVYSSGLSTGINKISTSHFLKGIYFIRIQDKDNGIQIFKTVKS
jgi:hypothetical protein